MMSPIRLAHEIEQLEAEVTGLIGRGTSCALIDRLRYKTEFRNGQNCHLSGLISSDRKVLTEGDLVEITGEENLLVLAYGSYTDTASHFGGIGWHFLHLDGKYSGLFHSSPAVWFIESLACRGHIQPVRPAGGETLALNNNRYQLASGLCEGTRVAWPLFGSKSPRKGILCFGLYAGRGYGSRTTSGVVWYVKFDDDHLEPVQYVQDILALSENGAGVVQPII